MSTDKGKGGQSEKPARTHRTVNGRENDSFSRLSLFSSVFICVHLWLQLHCYGSERVRKVIFRHCPVDPAVAGEASPALLSYDGLLTRKPLLNKPPRQEILRQAQDDGTFWTNLQGTISVPMPALVKISSRRPWWMCPPIMWTFSTPFSSAPAADWIFGIIPPAMTFSRINASIWSA